MTAAHYHATARKLDLGYRGEDNQIQGWMSEADLEVLYEWALDCDSIIEVGCWKGRSTHALLSGCRGRVYAVDHFKGSESERDTVHAEAKSVDIMRIFLNNLGAFNNLVVVPYDSARAVKVLPDVDMVFLDSEHAYESVIRDIVRWFPKCRKWLCGHDANFMGVPSALRNSKLDWKGVPGSGSLWIAKVDANPGWVVPQNVMDELGGEGQ